MYEDKYIYRHLKTLGISPGIRGYDYIMTAMKLVMEDRTYLSKITSRLYPRVAQEHGGTAARVERAIRHAVQRMHDCTEPGIVTQYFGSTWGIRADHLTNKQFLAGLLEYIRMEEGY